MRGAAIALRVIFDLVVVVTLAPIRWLLAQYPSPDGPDLPDDPGEDVDGFDERHAHANGYCGADCTHCLSSHPELRVDGVPVEAIDFDEELPTRPLCRCPHQDANEPFDNHAPGCGVRVALTRGDR